MKQFCRNNGFVATSFLALWALLVIIEVKGGLLWLLAPIFFLSLPCVFIGFYVASFRTFFGWSDHAAAFATLTSALMSPMFIVVGVTLITNFKLMIGGHL